MRKSILKPRVAINKSENKALEHARQIVRDAAKEFPDYLESLSFEEVKERASGRWKKIFELFCPDIIRPDSNNNDYSVCPMCGKNAKFKFFSDFEEEGGCICLAIRLQTRNWTY